MMEALVVEWRHGRFYIYDKLGAGGSIELSKDEAETVRDRLDEILERLSDDD